MMKKIAILCLCLFAFQTLNATAMPLKTGRWVIDRYRNVDIDQFDYSYVVQSTDHSHNMLELEDGSLWQVVPMNEETASFYEQRNALGVYAYPNSIFDLWQAGDTLIFHKVVNRPSLLAYNLTKDLMLDVQPVASPTTPLLTITSVSNTNEISYGYTYIEKTNSFQQYQSNNWRTIIALSDGSVWEGNPGRALVSWIVGDPIHISKDTPWWSSNTHILMNFRTKKTSKYQSPDYSRLGVWRAG